MDHKELAVSQKANLHCGESTIPWEDFHVGYLLIGNHFFGARPDALPNFSGYGQVVQLMFTYNMSKENSPNLDLLSLLESHRMAVSTDTRDKVYGLLGIHQLYATQAHSIIPDYGRPASDVFTEVAQTIIETYPTLDLLGIPRMASTSLSEKLPSWVPDWSTSDLSCSLSLKMTDGSYALDFDAARTSIFPKYTLIQNDVLKLNGHGLYFQGRKSLIPFS